MSAIVVPQSGQKDRITFLHIKQGNIEEMLCLEEYASLVSLVCCNLGLKSLPALPATLQSLYCQNNQLTELPPLPLGLYALHCANNPFKHDIYNQGVDQIRLYQQAMGAVCDVEVGDGLGDGLGEAMRLLPKGLAVPEWVQAAVEGDDQRCVVRALEWVCGAGRDPSANMALFPVVLKRFFDTGLVEEEVFLAWHVSPVRTNDPLLSAETLLLLRRQAEPFINWLLEADADDG